MHRLSKNIKNVLACLAIALLTMAALPSPNFFDISINGVTIRSLFVAHVTTNDQLKLKSTTFSSQIFRDGYYVAGDSPPVYYNASTSPCSLNSGNGDDGSQVKSADGNCWLINPGQSLWDPRWFGAKSLGSSFDNLQYFNKLVTYLRTSYTIGTSTNINIAPGTDYGLSCTVALNGIQPVSSNYFGLGIVGGGTLVGTTSTCASATAPAEPVPLVSITNANWRGTVSDIRFDGNFQLSGLLVSSGSAGAGTLKSTIRDIETVRFVNPAYANEAAYDPNYNTAYGRIYINYTAGSTARFVNNETITGGTSGATRTVYNVENNALLLKGGSGTFTAGETVTGGTSTAAATLTTAVNGAAATENTVYLAPGPETNTYRPYGLRLGSQATASPVIASSQTQISNVDAKQYLPGDAGYTDETKHTGICIWLSAVDSKSTNLTGSGCRKGLVVDGATNTVNAPHFFPVGFPTTQHEWTGIEANAGNNTFNNWYQDHSQYMFNDPRQILGVGRVMNVAVPQTPISAAISLAVPSACASPCNLGSYGPLSISPQVWYKNAGAGASSGTPQLVKYWAPPTYIGNVNIVSAGSSHAVNDIININVGTACSVQPSIKVASVVAGGSGAINTVSMNNNGVCTSVPSGTFSQTSTSGTGTGASFSLVAPSFAGTPPWELTGNQGIYISNPLDVVQTGNNNIAVMRIYGGGTQAMACFTDSTTSPGGQQCIGSTGNSVAMRSGGVNMQFFAGNGSPNGVVTARPPAMYYNSAGGAAATFWVKESGINTNTGWVGK